MTEITPNENTSEQSPEDLRPKTDTGIPLLGATEWGTNICLFYETMDDLMKPTASFFKSGLDRHERCIWSVSAPVTVELAVEALEAQMPQIEAFLRSGAMFVTDAEPWDVREDEFNLERITAKWSEELAAAESRGFEGLRISGNASWLEAGHWSPFCEYDQEMDRTVAGRKIIVLCTHSLSAKREVDFDEIVRGHHFTLYCRNGSWEFPETSELARATAEVATLTNDIQNVVGAIDIFLDLTPREKVVLAQIVHGGSSKAIALNLGISPRTIEFHRSNIMSKVGAKNVADLVRIMSGQSS